MKVKIKEGKKHITVDVNYKDCPKRSCFYYGSYTHLSSGGSSTATKLTCLRRDNHGCPEWSQK